MSDIEARLRAFRPRRPAAIPDERLQRLRGPIWLAVAAGMAAVMFVSSRLQKPTPVAGVTAPATLTELALERPDEFEAELSKISAASLPDVTKPDGALAPFAKGF